MMKRLTRRILSFTHGREQGGIALMTVLAFLGLAIPVILGSVQLTGILNLNSQTYERGLVSEYSAGAAIEYTIWEILNDPNFDEGLTPENPSKETILQMNEQTVTVTTTKIFTGSEMQGQALVVDKTVTPTTAPVNTETTFTYTITITNEGGETVRLKHIRDYLPPYFTYVSGSTSGLTTADPEATNEGTPITYGPAPYRLEWNFVPSQTQIAPQEEVTLTFDAIATLPDGTYYNQVMVHYEPWWDGPNVNTYTPYTAEVTVGTGTPECGYGLNVLVTKTVEPQEVEPGVETEFTYTISIENCSSATQYIYRIEDLLPSGFTYVTGSSGGYPENIDTREPYESWRWRMERWRLRWENIEENPLLPLTSIAPGETKTQVFRAMATPESEADYFNEVSVVWTENPQQQDWVELGAVGGTSWGGASGSSSVDAGLIYDIAAVAQDGAILSRVVLYEKSNQFEIVSWQQSKNV